MTGVAQLLQTHTERYRDRQGDGGEAGQLLQNTSSVVKWWTMSASNVLRSSCSCSASMFTVGSSRMMSTICQGQRQQMNKLRTTSNILTTCLWRRVDVVLPPTATSTQQQQQQHFIMF